MKIFQRNKTNSNLELISIHIPKTAGTSFRNILKDVYGDKNVVRLDIPNNVELNKKKFEGNKLDPEIRVVHGHFSYKRLTEAFEIQKDIPVITWLRDPATRVISNYYYLDMILRKELDEERKGLNILLKMEKSLLEYASTKVNRNRIWKFMKGMAIEDLFFVGLTEHYEEDLKYLGQKLGWKKHKIFQHNPTADKPEVDQETIDRIKELNSKDYKIYNRALELRKERINRVT
jgi:hypothetical protein